MICFKLANGGMYVNAWIVSFLRILDAPSICKRILIRSLIHCMLVDIYQRNIQDSSIDDLWAQPQKIVVGYALQTLPNAGKLPS